METYIVALCWSITSLLWNVSNQFAAVAAVWLLETSIFEPSAISEALILVSDITISAKWSNNVYIFQITWKCHVWNFSVDSVRCGFYCENLFFFVETKNTITVSITVAVSIACENTMSKNNY